MRRVNRTIKVATKVYLFDFLLRYFKKFKTMHSVLDRIFFHGFELSLQMATGVLCELSPPIILAPQAGIRDGLIALQALLKNRASLLASQAIRSTFSTQITPVPSTLLCARSRKKERGICWMSVQLSASVAPQPDALKTGRTIHPSQSTDP